MSFNKVMLKSCSYSWRIGISTILPSKNTSVVFSFTPGTWIDVAKNVTSSIPEKFISNLHLRAKPKSVIV